MGIVTTSVSQPVRRVSWQYAVVPILLLAIWQGVVASGFVHRSLFPAPMDALEAWWIWVFGTDESVRGPYNGTWLPNAWASLWRVFAGFSIAALSGIVVGLLIGWFTLPRKLLQPVIDLLRPVPVTAWVPFTVVFFGIRPAASVSLIALGAFFPVVVNAAAGASGTPTVLVQAARMMGTSKGKILWRVVLPNALPPIVTGMRVALSIAWVLVIVSEMVAVKSGLGFSLWDAYYFGRVDVIVAAMFSVGILGFASDQLMVRTANGLMRWMPDLR